jgi:hypothetical protein
VGSRTRFGIQRDHENSPEKRQNSVLNSAPILLHGEEVDADPILRMVDVSRLNSAFLEDCPPGKVVGYVGAVVIKMSTSVAV